jgi:hypothetical protein
VAGRVLTSTRIHNERSKVTAAKPFHLVRD